MAKPPDLVRLRKALLVMLSSDQTGEIIAASALTQKLLKAAGKDIHWLADRLLDETPVQQYPVQAESDWRDMLNSCLAHVDRLRFKDREFIWSLNDQRLYAIYWEPSPKQTAWLVNIYERIKLYS